MPYSFFQHYQTIHGLKNYTCVHCGKKFALRDAYNRHQQECQQKIVCSTCGLDFRSRNALYQHAKRKGHTLPDGKKVKAAAVRSDRVSNSVNVVLVPIPTSIKLVVPVSRKRTVVSISTQTEESHTHKLYTERSPEVMLQSSSSQTMSELPLCPFNHTHLLCSPSELLSLGTQTTSPAPDATPLVVLTQACQTPAAQLCDFGTQTQTDANALPLDVISDNSIASCTTNSPSCYSDGSALSLVEFGTQTACSEPYNISELDMVDFGTQTNGMCSLELDDSLFILPPECMDFGTQTLDFALDCVSHSVQTCLHSSDTRDQSSQT